MSFKMKSERSFSIPAATRLLSPRINGARVALIRARGFTKERVGLPAHVAAGGVVFTGGVTGGGIEGFEGVFW